MARDHLIPHFEPRAFENFAALEGSLLLSFLHPSRSDQRQILVELGAGQPRTEREAYQKFVKFPFKLEGLSLST